MFHQKTLIKIHVTVVTGVWVIHYGLQIRENRGVDPWFLLFLSVWSPLTKYGKRMFELVSKASILIDLLFVSFPLISICKLWNAVQIASDFLTVFIDYQNMCMLCGMRSWIAYNNSWLINEPMCHDCAAWRDFFNNWLKTPDVTIIFNLDLSICVFNLVLQAKHCDHEKTH